MRLEEEVLGHHMSHFFALSFTLVFAVTEPNVFEEQNHCSLFSRLRGDVHTQFFPPTPWNKDANRSSGLFF